MSVKLKRAYDAPASLDGVRYLVDRLWPRGLKKSEARIDGWLRDLAPSTALRVWFGHRPDRWNDFRRRYGLELRSHAADLDKLAVQAKRHNVTLVYAARDKCINHAVVLRRHLLSRLRRLKIKQGRR